MDMLSIRSRRVRTLHTRQRGRGSLKMAQTRTSLILRESLATAEAVMLQLWMSGSGDGPEQESRIPGGVLIRLKE